MKGAALAAVLVLAACGSSSASATLTPGPAGSPASVSPSAAASASAPASPSPAATPTSAAALVHCTATVPPADNLIIGMLTGSAAVVIRDIQDITHPLTLCTIDAHAHLPRFVSGGQVGYVTDAGDIVKADLATGATSAMAHASSGLGFFSFSPDGRAVTYLDGSAWHLADAAGDRLLTTLPPVPGRGVDQLNDDTFLSYSPDGLYIALVQTFATGGSGATAPAQVRRASDGSLVFSTSGVTMGVWASVPSRLFFRDTSGHVKRWDPSSGVADMFAAQWIRPQASPDGRWIAYTFRAADGTGGVGFYSVQGNSVVNTSPPGRSSVRFLNNTLVWYIGERACSSCFGGFPTPTGVTYIYDIGGTTETASRITSLLDAWPHTTAPAL